MSGASPWFIRPRESELDQAEKGLPVNTGQLSKIPTRVSMTNPRSHLQIPASGTKPFRLTHLEPKRFSHGLVLVSDCWFERFPGLCFSSTVN